MQLQPENSESFVLKLWWCMCCRVSYDDGFLQQQWQFQSRSLISSLNSSWSHQRADPYQGHLHEGATLVTQLVALKRGVFNLPSLVFQAANQRARPLTTHPGVSRTVTKVIKRNIARAMRRPRVLPTETTDHIHFAFAQLNSHSSPVDIIRFQPNHQWTRSRQTFP